MNVFSALDLSPRKSFLLLAEVGRQPSCFRLADEIPRHYNVVITTTTKILVPPTDKYPVLLTEDHRFEPDQVKRFLDIGRTPTLASRLLPGNKLQGISLEQFADIAGWQHIDFILAEADGAKNRPLKGHLEYEPVIPPSTTVLVIVVGADVIGQRLDSEYVHRSEVVAALTGSTPGAVIHPETIARLILHPRGIMRLLPSQTKTVVILNKVDCLPSTDQAYQTAHLLLGNKINKVILCSAISESPIIDIITRK
jgi:probable selenium-dependent hydroxylase accessory protein YqeC